MAQKMKRKKNWNLNTIHISKLSYTIWNKIFFIVSKIHIILQALLN